VNILPSVTVVVRDENHELSWKGFMWLLQSSVSV